MNGSSEAYRDLGKQPETRVMTITGKACVYGVAFGSIP